MKTQKLETGHTREGKWIKVPVSDITTPKAGRIVYGARWWAVTDNDEVLFYESYCSPQCNPNKAVVDHVLNRESDMPKTTPRYFEFTFLPHDCRDYI